MKIQHQEHSVEEVIRYFVDGYNLEPGQRVASHEYNYDPHTGKVWLKLVVEEADLLKSEE